MRKKELKKVGKLRILFKVHHMCWYACEHNSTLAHVVGQTG